MDTELAKQMAKDAVDMNVSFAEFSQKYQLCWQSFESEVYGLTPDEKSDLEHAEEVFQAEEDEENWIPTKIVLKFDLRESYSTHLGILQEIEESLDWLIGENAIENLRLYNES